MGVFLKLNLPEKEVLVIQKNMIKAVKRYTRIILLNSNNSEVFEETASGTKNNKR